jgi:hypothetical protein
MTVMHEIPGATSGDFPAPPAIDDVARNFGGPVFTLVPQPSLQEISLPSTVSENGRLREVSLSYSYFRHPDNRADSRNFAENAEATTTMLRTAEAERQPAWFIEALGQRRYPLLWEAVLTVGRGGERSVTQVLSDHLRHVLSNTWGTRRPNGFDGTDASATGARTERAREATLEIDGVMREAMVLDSDPDVIGWAAPVEGSVVVLVLDRDIAPTLDLRLIRRNH